MATTTNLKNTASEMALDFIEKNRKRFYREWYKRWDKRCILLDQSGSNWIHEFRKRPNYYAELDMISQSLMSMGFLKIWKHGFGFKDTAIIYEKYRKRFVKHKLIPTVKRNGGVFPHENKTRAIHEFLLRGFVHKDEFKMEDDKHHILCTIAPLIWPMGFHHHQDAIRIQGEFGIPGYTSTTLKLIKNT